MKTLKLSLLAIALFSMFSMTLTSCGGDKSEDPKPVTPVTPTKTDLEVIQAALVGVQIHTIKGQVGSTVIDNLCSPPTGYENAVTNMTFSFTSATTVTLINDCKNFTADYTYTVTQDGNLFNVKIKATVVVVDAVFLKSDFIGSDGKVLQTAKATFNELSSPKSWVGSPVMTLQRKN